MNAVFFDRDGTIIIEPPDEQIDSLEKLELIPGVIKGLSLLRDRGFELIMVSNQDSLGTNRYPKASFEKVQSKLLRILEGEGIRFSNIFICPHTPSDQCGCRKPKTGLVDEFFKNHSIDLSCSFRSAIGKPTSSLERTSAVKQSGYRFPNRATQILLAARSWTPCQVHPSQYPLSAHRPNNRRDLDLDRCCARRNGFPYH